MSMSRNFLNFFKFFSGTFVSFYAKLTGGPKAVICPLPVSEYLLSREDHKKPAFAGVGYLFRKRAIVALFALSSEFNSNFLKPNFCSTKRTIASLVISTFFAFSIMFSLIYINYYTGIFSLVNRYFKLFEKNLSTSYPQPAAPIIPYPNTLVKRKFHFFAINFLGNVCFCWNAFEY